MSFEQLEHVTKIGHAKFSYFLLVSEWSDKRQNLFLYLSDLQTLAQDYMQSKKQPYKQNPKITLVDQVPRIRLSSACEASTNTVYAMAEIAAQFGNKTTKGLFPSSFNAFRKKFEKNSFNGINLEKWITDLQWYKKVREIRTEWVHFSSVFIAEESGEPIMVVRCNRRHSDREEFKERIQVKISELSEWIRNAITTIDNFGNYLLEYHVIPSLDFSAEITTVKCDENSYPIIKENNLLEVEKITIEEYLAKCGIHKKQ